MTDTHDTQALPDIDMPEPTPPKPPTLASVIISEVEGIHEDIRIFNSNTIVYWGGLSFQVSRLQALVIVLIAAVGVSILLNVAVLVFLAWLVGHVR
jgi:hypothetical protein